MCFQLILLFVKKFMVNIYLSYQDNDDDDQPKKKKISASKMRSSLLSKLPKGLTL